MNNLRKSVISLTNEIVYGDHLVGLAAVGMLLSIILIFDLKFSLSILVIAYLTYLIIYAYNHFGELESDKDSNPERVKHLLKKRTFKRILFTIYISVLSVLLAFTNVKVIILIVIIIIGGILYTAYFKKLPILGFKSYYVSFFWSLLALLPPFFYKLEDLTPYLFLAIFLFVRVFLNTVFFDIKDIASDSKRNIKTFPVYFGKKKTLYMLQIVNLISLIPLVVGVQSKYVPIVSLSFVIIVINGIFYLSKAMFLNDKSLRFLSYIFLDGEYMFWPLIILIGKFIIE